MQSQIKWFLDKNHKLYNKDILSDKAKEITDEVKTIISYLYKTNTKNLICTRCGSLVIKSVTKGYSFYCPRCNEDLFNFETTPKTHTTGDDIICFLERFFENEDYRQIVDDIKEDVK